MAKLTLSRLERHLFATANICLKATLFAPQHTGEHNFGKRLAGKAPDPSMRSGGLRYSLQGDLIVPHNDRQVNLKNEIRHPIRPDTPTERRADRIDASAVPDIGRQPRRAGDAHLRHKAERDILGRRDL